MERKMPRQIRIDFDLVSIETRRETAIHRVRNFHEELWMRARETGTILCSLEGIGRTTTIHVTVRSARRLRRELAKIGKLLRRHGFIGTAHIAIVEPPKG
jgi:hypothetical protein